MLYLFCTVFISDPLVHKNPPTNHKYQEATVHKAKDLYYYYYYY